MTTDVRTPVDVDAPAPISPPPAPPSRRKGGRAWQFVLGGLVGGLCGALAAGGLFLAFDDDGGGSSPTPAVRTAEIDRSSSTIGGEQGDVASIIAKVEPAVVTITTEISGPVGGDGQGAGTGFVISSDGVIVTNNHVIAGANTIEVAFLDGRTVEAEVVGRDAGADLAVLKVDATGLPVVELGDSDALQVGDEVVAIGNALALEGGLTVTRGIVSGPPRDGTELGAGLASFVQTDASINPGNSGGPLVDAAGRVIGINTFVAGALPGGGQAENVGFAIPISDAMPVIEDLRAGRVPAFLGVATDTLTPEIADEIGVDADSGAVILEVTPDSPADEAGLREEDVLVRIGDQTIESASDVPDAIRRHQPGDEVEVEVIRGDQRETVTARLVERADSVG